MTGIRCLRSSLRWGVMRSSITLAPHAGCIGSPSCEVSDSLLRGGQLPRD
jgi:hypothetical protein